MASERIKNDMDCGLPSEVWLQDATGDHITLPLDANALDDAAVEEAATAYLNSRSPYPLAYQTLWRVQNPLTTQQMRAAIAAYARHVAGGE